MGNASLSIWVISFRPCSHPMYLLKEQRDLIQDLQELQYEKRCKGTTEATTQELYIKKELHCGVVGALNDICDIRRIQREVDHVSRKATNRAIGIEEVRLQMEEESRAADEEGWGDKDVGGALDEEGA